MGVSRVAVVAGGVAAVGLAGLYAGVVGGVGGWEHLLAQAVADTPWLVLIVTGFAVQVGLYAELRRRHRLAASSRAAAGAGGTASAVGMVACCAHHVADLAPIIGLSGAAVFLTAYRTPIMAAGIILNALGVAVALRRLRRAGLPARQVRA